MIRLWDVARGRLLTKWQAHAGLVNDVSLRSDGRLLASGGFDGAVRLWAIEGEHCRPLATWYGHVGTVWGVAVGDEPTLVVSGGDDGTVRFWDADQDQPVEVLRADRRYERLDITGTTGLTDAQRTTLALLGAVEHQPV
jgi:WD40 repeat protein